ncbi:MAG: hypothetical protein LBS37_08560 [Treponema sp.]|nr:hypothetical protein [Treponema sp.]
MPEKEKLNLLKKGREKPDEEGPDRTDTPTVILAGVREIPPPFIPQNRTTTEDDA